MTMSRAGVSAAVIILSFLLNDFNSLPSSSVVAYDYEFNSICNGTPLKDSSPLKVTSKRSLDNVASRADSSSGVVDFCEDGSDDSGTYTMHGQGGCVAADDCSDCIAQAEAYLWSNCQNQLGGRAHEEETDVVALAGGSTFPVELGRRDGMISSASLVVGNLPNPNMTLPELNTIFAKHNLTQFDMIALSGAHTLGFSHCGDKKQRNCGDKKQRNRLMISVILMWRRCIENQFAQRMEEAQRQQLEYLMGPIWDSTAAVAEAWVAQRRAARAAGVTRRTRESPSVGPYPEPRRVAEERIGRAARAMQRDAEIAIRITNFTAAYLDLIRSREDLVSGERERERGASEAAIENLEVVENYLDGSAAEDCCSICLAEMGGGRVIKLECVPLLQYRCLKWPYAQPPLLFEALSSLLSPSFFGFANFRLRLSLLLETLYAPWKFAASLLLLPFTSFSGMYSTLPSVRCLSNQPCVAIYLAQEVVNNALIDLTSGACK
ncbi:Peroxidase 16 [Linum grandiflorum]